MTRIFREWMVVLAVVTALLAGPMAVAQIEQLSPEQRRMLEQLPESERRELRRQFEGQRRERDDAELTDDRVDFPDIDDARLRLPDEEEREARRERLEGGDTLVIRLEPDRDVVGGFTTGERQQVERTRTRINRNNPFVLDDEGRVDLPGVARIPLAGLTGPQAVIRLQAEERLRGFRVRLTRLPLKPVGTDALKPFGYELFTRRDDDRRPTTFAPATDIPVPADHVVGVGDNVRIQLFGNRNADYSLTVNRDGLINFPEIGPLNVAGQKFDDMRADIRSRVEEQFIGTRVSVSLGDLRSIRVFVLGDVRRPGAYTVSSLSTVTHTLFVSGGISEEGSLRNVQVKREGETVRVLDLYDLLLRGDSRDDIRLRSGDVVFVPPVGERVTVFGLVRRPAIYELRGERTAESIVEVAGGTRPGASPSSARLERLDPDEGISVTGVDLMSTAGRNTRLQDGDVLRVPAGVAQFERAVVLAGNVYHPGDYQWQAGHRLTDLLSDDRDLRPRSDLHYVLIRREVRPGARIEVFSADLEAAWDAPGTEADPELRPRDTVYVFNLDAGREHIIEPILEDLRAQSSPDSQHAVVRVAGPVKAPGEYPLEPGMRVADLVRAGGGLDESAYPQSAELTRYTVANGEFRETRVRDIDLARALSGIDGINERLNPHDLLTVRTMPRWRDQESIEIVGEVEFPGRYPISPGDTLSSVLERAGGLSDYAFPQGAIFTREALRDREREQLERMASRLESDLASVAMADPDNIEAVSVGQSLLQQIRATEPTGRLVIDLTRAAAGHPERDISLRDGDRLMIPEQAQEVTVLGEVQFATSHVYDSTLARDDYIDRSGGLTPRADKGRIYVVRASGEVLVQQGSRWFGSRQGPAIEPGDTIVVPLDAERVRPLLMWTNVTEILFNLAIAAAAVNSF